MGLAYRFLICQESLESAPSGKGLGKRVLSVARSADLILIILDVFQTHHLSILKKELSDIGIKVDEKPPNVTLRRPPPEV